MTIDLKKIKTGDRRELAKAITLVEDSRSDSKLEVEKLFKNIPIDNKTIRIAITGIPGSGKSSLIEKLGLYAIKEGKKVAVLAIDPSSPINGGSILGDKIRMEQLSLEKNAFIRPSPSRGHLGGVAFSTFETILLCEYAGFDFILIETIGVGQSEFEAKTLSDIFLYLAGPNTGDEIQGIKRGILELSDIIVVNKHDGDSKIQAEVTKGQLENSLHIKGIDNINILLASAIKNDGILEIYNLLLSLSKNKNFFENRKKQVDNWIINLTLHYISEEMKNSKNIKMRLAELKDEIWMSKKSSYDAVKSIIKELKKDI